MCDLFNFVGHCCCVCAVCDLLGQCGCMCVELHFLGRCVLYTMFFMYMYVHVYVTTFIHEYAYILTADKTTVEFPTSCDQDVEILCRTGYIHMYMYMYM